MDTLKPLLDVLVQLGATALLGGGAWATHWFAKKLRLDNDAQVRSYLNDALAAGVDYGISQVRARLGISRDTPESLAIVATHASQYVIERVPDALNHFGITDAALAKMVQARLPMPAAPAAPTAQPAG